MKDITKCSIRPSRHALCEMSEEAISVDKVRSVITFGMRRIFKDKIISTMQGVEVVYKAMPCNIFIITAYLKR